MSKLKSILICVCLFVCSYLKSQNLDLGKYEIINLKGYTFYKLAYDSLINRYRIREIFFLSDKLTDTFTIIGQKNIIQLQKQYQKFKREEFKNQNANFKKGIYDIYKFDYDSINNEYLKGTFYTNKKNELFIVSKIYNKAIIFYNPKSDVFKLIYGNYYNKPPYIYMIKPIVELRKLDYKDISKIGLKISDKVRIPLEL